ncbi:hypothetical protein SDC9_160622 [bioreactor metagenome]|uniref:Uncharacterized protein n=1 Tax=bioreactor metagenome TaxID=1076179 RepID=A0A645FG11_9ZZZZ
MRHGVVRDEALQPADADRFALDAAHAPFLALRLLRADTSADGGQGIGRANDVVGLQKLALNHQLNELRNADVDGATLHARLSLAVEAARRFVDGHRLVVALGHLFEIAVANVWVLLARGQLRQSHIRHVQFPPRLA